MRSVVICIHLYIVKRVYTINIYTHERGSYMATELLTTEELAARIKYDPRTIRERLKDSVLLEGTHYIRPFGGRKLLFVWEAIERDIGQASARLQLPIPMANGRVLRG